MFGLTALSDDAKAVVVKVSEAVSAALDEFHFPMEALCDGVGSGEAPHNHQLQPGYGLRNQSGSGSGFSASVCEDFDLM